MNYFFYKDYMFNRKIKHSNPLWVSSIMVSIMEFFNGLSIWLIINSFYFNVKATVVQVLSVFIIIGIILFIINAIYYNKNEKRICEKYKGESLTRSIVGYVIYIVYYIGSIALMFILKERFGLHL
jgi:uncharacterized membrane protein YidH (DUF202 family)